MITDENKIMFLIKILGFMSLHDYKIVYILKDWGFELTKDEVTVLRKKCFQKQLIDYLE